jgi:GMP synthase (glutamine-hydrolysing)
VWDAGVPVLGICYGMQTMAVQLGGTVSWSDHREFGYAEVRAHGHTRLLNDIADFTTADGHGMLKVWMSHGDKVTELPPGFKLMASTPSCPIAGMADEARGYYALQFHPEVTHTVQGMAMLTRFVRDIAGCRGDWIMGNYVDEAVARIREQVGDEEVILGLSGGVDSSVAAALIHRAIGDQLTCVFVDHGLLRLNEGAMVMDMFAGRLHAKVIHVQAQAQFLGHLQGVTDPEAKRKIIGREFVEVFQAEAAKLKGRAGRRCQRREVAGPRHHLPRRGRERGHRQQEGHHHQEPPQRRRLARHAGAEAAGAAARTVQGRSARSAWRWACRTTWSTAILSPALAWACASWAR